LEVTPRQRELHPPQVSSAKGNSGASDSNAKDKRQLNKAGIILTGFAGGIAFMLLVVEFEESFIFELHSDYASD
jgi:hypothetical protein